jgi:hypothetical protein
MYQSNKERQFELEQNYRQDEEQTQRENQYDLMQMKAEEFKQDLIDAKQYIGYGIKEGYFEPEQFEKMENYELINFYREASAQAENYADQERKGE